MHQAVTQRHGVEAAQAHAPGQQSALLGAAPRQLVDSSLSSLSKSGGIHSC